MELVAHPIAIVRAVKRVVKLAEIADIIMVCSKLPNKNHSHHNDGNGKKLGDTTGKFNLCNSH
ncbi:hypothetical protein CDG76_23700 [Nostoc sp. 'Peltigera membranacea cyanobiont' 210A]|nr:hypothetical protein CDG76_23700 [Nostoc sp. 'Peltigera membranacea cyanobiont' 210A]